MHMYTFPLSLTHMAHVTKPLVWSLSSSQHRITYLADNVFNAKRHYWVAILTGIRGTTGEVSMRLIGDNGTSAKHVLEDKNTNVPLFQIGSEHWFILSERRSLGRLRTVVVWVDYSNAAPSWWVRDDKYPYYLAQLIRSLT